MDTKIYKVAITETYRKIVAVEATSPQQAHTRARDAYINTELRLDDSNYEGTEFYAVEANEQYSPKAIELIERKE